MKRPEQSISGKVGGSTTADDRTSHAFNINGEKLVITRDSKVTDKAIQDAAAKLAHAEIEDTDIEIDAIVDIVTHRDIASYRCRHVNSYRCRCVHRYGYRSSTRFKIK